MSSSLERPPFQADERTALVGWLDLQRQILRWKCEGLSEADAHRSVIPTSPAMTMAGLISHMRWVEHSWLDVLFLGGDKTQNPSLAEMGEDAEWRTDGIPLKQLLADYEAQCARSNEIVAEASLDDVGRHPDYRSSGANLRWMLIHLIEETGRHAGHADIVRELLDGAKGYY
ncbi:DinB family protein [Streptomyces griseorubiginosus]|uniref:DinB family protein n=1 Tax=Streptomyces griseorubiginosus TaxID=67304 RepID=UPI002E81F5CF|nr:DinB family protein [Streptomyces griseorubiginosus]WUB47947.1 DinB family protein [Streptomyces griseorubiginosus]WUB56472.1 DinB family protein [Streptomyces griseorubiginosus]